MKKEEKLLHAIGGIDDELIRDAMVKPRRTPARRGWIKWTAAAACLCLLLASPAGASMLGKVKELTGMNGHAEFYTTDRFTVEDFSEEAREAAAQQDSRSEHYPMEDAASAEAFLGLDFPDNDIIDFADPKTITLDRADETYEAPCLVNLTKTVENELSAAAAWSAYYLDHGQTEVWDDDGQFEVWYIATTQERPADEHNTVGIEIADAEREDYVTPEGLECILYSRYVGYAFGAWEARGFAVVDGYLAYVTVYEWSPDEAMDSLRNIMDAYG